MEENDPNELSPENFPLGAATLPDDFFWDCTDENSPLGNDTGSDVFYALLNRKAEFPQSDTLDFLVLLLDDWGIADEDWDLVDPEQIDRLLKVDEFTLITRDDAIIALAFAEIVLTGKVNPITRERALRAIERQLLSGVIEHRLGSGSPYERIEKLKRMKEVLRDAFLSSSGDIAPGVES